MFFVRPVKEDDLDTVERFANTISLGMLSLPKDRDLLSKKIKKSKDAFVKEIEAPKDEFYFFVLEHTHTGAVGGCCGIYAKTGMEYPVYYYQLETIKRKKSTLPIPDEVRILHPRCETEGPSELCALFLEKKLRKEKLGELLSLSRFLFIAEHLNRFENKVIARLRGFINKSKMTSPFWEGLGKHFLEMEFTQVQNLHARGTEFAAEFLPKYPIYVSLLPKQAQHVIQKPHLTTKPAMKMLEKEGFLLNDQIDILEAGPVMQAETITIRSIKNSLVGTVVDISTDDISTKPLIIANRLVDFRACYGSIKLVREKGVILTEETAKALNVTRGDEIRFVVPH